MTKSVLSRGLALTSILALAACNSILGNKERPLATGGTDGSGADAGASGSWNGGSAGELGGTAGKSGGGSTTTPNGGRGAGGPNTGGAQATSGDGGSTVIAGNAGRGNMNGGSSAGGGAGTSSGGASAAGSAGMNGGSNAGGSAGMNGGGGEGGSPPSVCGNGVVEAGEGCDDYNQLSGDGCSASCQPEPGFTCNDLSPSACFKPGPSCTGLAATCGSDGKQNCCASSVITGGTFNRGNNVNYPATVSDFRLDTYEITVGRFRTFMANYVQPAGGSGRNQNNQNNLAPSVDSGWNASWNTDGSLETSVLTIADNLSCTPYATWTTFEGAPADESRPIDCLDWFYAEAFCIWDGGRLPTEAEWNFAAAGGSEQRLYPWGSTVPVDNAALANHSCLYVDGGCNGAASVAPVGSIPAGNGKWGQADLAGNVWEWVQDWFTSTYANPCDNCSYLPTASSTTRVLRGGSFYFNESFLLTSDRSYDSPSTLGLDYGARCARAR
jgi:sulfatase modifying factor 1